MQVNNSLILSTSTLRPSLRRSDTYKDLHKGLKQKDSITRVNSSEKINKLFIEKGF